MRKYSILLVIITFFFTSFSYAKEVNSSKTYYAVAKFATPVLYTDDFSWVFWWSGSQLKFDDYWEIDELEFIALPKTVFVIKWVILKPNNVKIFKVETTDYPYPTDKWYYIDSRFVKIYTTKPSDRIKELPSKEDILKNLVSASGSIYTRWGNNKRGILQMLIWYPPLWNIEKELKDQWTLKWVDCSGLLYEATKWYTPRNTSTLVNYGTWVNIEWKNIDEIIEQVQPLDIIVWRWHMIVILDKNTAIQSRVDYDDKTEGFQWWVRILPLKDVLLDVLNTKIPANNYDTELVDWKKKFVIRRWYK